MVLLIALAGLSAVVLRWSWGRASLDKARARGIAWLAVVVCLGLVQVLLGLGLSGEDLPQGRHLFPALPALCLLLAFGLRSALPGRLGVAMVVGALVFLLAFDLFVMWRVALVGFYL